MVMYYNINFKKEMFCFAFIFWIVVVRFFPLWSSGYMSNFAIHNDSDHKNDKEHIKQEIMLCRVIFFDHKSSFFFHFF